MTACYKRELLYRKAQGNKLKNTYEQKISCVLSNNHDNILRLQLLETDNILKKTNMLNWQLILSKEYHSLADCLRTFAPEVYQEEFYTFIDEDWKYCGAIKIPKHTQLNPQYSFDKSISDELRFIATDFSTQIAIDYSVYGKSELYECTIKRSLQEIAQPKGV